MNFNKHIYYMLTLFGFVISTNSPVLALAPDTAIQDKPLASMTCSQLAAEVDGMNTLCHKDSVKLTPEETSLCSKRDSGFALSEWSRRNCGVEGQPKKCSKLMDEEKMLIEDLKGPIPDKVYRQIERTLDINKLRFKRLGCHYREPFKTF